MTLSDKAEKGRKTAVLVSVMCFAVALFSLISLNILMAAIGFVIAYHIGKGSLTARNCGVILSISQLPVLTVMIIMTAGHIAPAYIIAASSIMIIDIAVLLMLSFNNNLNTYFREVFESKAEETTD